MEKVFIIVIHDMESRPWIDRVFSRREDAESYCKAYNDCHMDETADFISEEVIR